MSKKDNRRPNFSDKEMKALVEGVAGRLSDIQDRFSSTISRESKNKAWAEILKEVNCVSTIGRTDSEIRKKYQALKSQVKVNEADNRKERVKTGGGEAETVEHDEIAAIIVRDILTDTQISGITGGFDSNESNIIEVQPVRPTNPIAPTPRAKQSSSFRIDLREEQGKRLFTSKAKDGISSGSTIKKAAWTTPNLQNKLMRKQVDLLSKQGNLFERRNEIEEEKLIIKKRQLEIEEEKLVLKKKKYSAM